MSKKIGIGAIALVAIIIAGYWGFDQLGGNTPIEISVIENHPPTLVGIHFRGTPQDPVLERAFKSVEAQKGLHPGSSLHTIYYSEPAGKLDTMEVFIGIDQKLPIEDFEVMDFKETSFLLASIKSNKWVMPNPTTVQKKLKEYALQHDIQLTGVFIDKIVSKSEVQVIAPIQSIN
ncbi:hypothetical protein [Algoriphagus halophilus]|uniref:GyrI-like small molecule binding domain-containing protein n=1 Tax=Algoriphagus halophilus TaxID=226505 RepID=A0A1N6GYX4_9BACT|nr:hypothetical protein [Algoriphagus halophilus]SIO12686.1 hypothetical protein SAMN05444394_3397 [Algoriphagus halophilus]